MAPLVSCLMVTANRPLLVARAVKCFERQTYENRELVIVDDGKDDLSELLESSSVSSKIRYLKLSPYPRLSLGELRNISINNSLGEWCCQWDDDEWYHPERIEHQVSAVLSSGAGACALKWTLMQIAAQDSGKILHFRADAGRATPGTILFRRDVTSQYPLRSRNEDGVFLRRLEDEVGLEILGRESSHLFVRVFHGSNTWEMAHFLKRLRRRPSDWITYAAARFLWRDLTKHKAFRLTQQEQSSIDDLLLMGHELGIS